MSTKTDAPARKGHLVHDEELIVMQRIAKAYDALAKLTPDARGRVKSWANAKFHPITPTQPDNRDAGKLGAE
jgi:hypothetical protein